MATQTSLGSKEIVTIDVHKADELIRTANYRYLDVRTEEEFKNGHVDVDNPLNIAYMFNTPEGRVKNPNFLEQVVQVCSKDEHLVVGCQSGVRSVYATIDLQNIEFKHVYNMGGGYLAWVKNGLRVTKPEAKIELPVPKVENGQLPVASAKLKDENSILADTVGENKSKNEPKVENGLPEIVTEPKVDKCLPDQTGTEAKIEL